MVVPRSALIIVNYAKTDLDGRGEMGLALRELASRKEKFDRIHLHARIVKSEAVRRKSKDVTSQASGSIWKEVLQLQLVLMLEVATPFCLAE